MGDSHTFYSVLYPFCFVSACLSWVQSFARKPVVLTYTVGMGLGSRSDEGVLLELNEI